jgi:hypothetical protein
MMEIVKEFHANTILVFRYYLENRKLKLFGSLDFITAIKVYVCYLMVVEGRNGM